MFARSSFFFFNDTATTEIYTLSLHDALPISSLRFIALEALTKAIERAGSLDRARVMAALRDLKRSEEHTSELQSLAYLVCRLLLEKKNKPDHCDTAVVV